MFCRLETRRCSPLIHVLEGRLVHVVILYLVIRTAFLTTEHVICCCSVVTRVIGWYRLVRRWSGNNSILGFRNWGSSHRYGSFRKMVAFQDPESVFTCGIFYADFLAIWVNVGIRTSSVAIWADGFALLKAIVCSEGVVEGAVLSEGLLVH